MKYKVGDKVKIREDLEIGKRYGSYCVAYEMISFCGQIATIKIMGIDGYVIDGSGCLWTDEMIERKADEIKLIDLFNMMANGEKMPKKFIFNGDEFYLQGDRFCYRCDTLNDILEKLYIFEQLNDYIEIIEDTPILDDKEKEYLSAVIKPFKDRVKTIRKNKTCMGNQYINICVDEISYIDLPVFEPNTMYKGMELNKGYTLEELGL